MIFESSQGFNGAERIQTISVSIEVAPGSDGTPYWEKSTNRGHYLLLIAANASTGGLKSNGVIKQADKLSVRFFPFREQTPHTKVIVFLN